jgi:TetR/AcrR family transcriptional repressor of bet genes
MPRPKNSGQRRAQIVDGLIDVMARSGYDGASIQEIARAAGLTPGLLHYHFGSKREILVAAVEQLIDGVRARYEARLAGGAPDARARLDAFIDAHLARGRDADARAVAAWSVVGAEAIRQPDVRAIYRRALGSSLRELTRLVTAVRRAEPGRSRSTLSAREAAAALMTAIEGAFRIAAAAPGALPAGYAAPTVRALARALA